MKRISPGIITGIFLFWGMLLCADVANDRELGDGAFYAGDYPNAIAAYEKVLAAADRTGDRNLWAECSLNLATAYLHSGKLLQAKNILESFRKRYQLRSSGTLEGEIMAAEGKFAEAEKFFLTMLPANPTEDDGRLFSLAMLYMNSGRVEEACHLFMKISGRVGMVWQPAELTELHSLLASGRVVQAGKAMGKLAARPQSPWRKYAAREAVYAHIRLEKLREAAVLLKQIPAEFYNSDAELLHYLLQARLGQTADFKKNFQSFLDRISPRQYRRLLELFTEAAQSAENAKDHEFAANLLKEALNFTGDITAKRNIHRQMLVALLKFSPGRTVTSAQDYFRNFPMADDRFSLLSDTAAILYNRKNFNEALKLYSFITDNTAGSSKEALRIRLNAASGAVNCAEAVKDFPALEKFNRIIIREAAIPVSVVAQNRYAAFLEKSGQIKKAGMELDAALQHARISGDASLIDKTAFLLLEFHIRHQNSDGISKCGRLLENSSNNHFAAVARMELGKLAADRQDYVNARNSFLSAVSLSDAEVTAPATFMAALMAYRDNNFRNAGHEFLACAVQFPKFEKIPEALFIAWEIFYDPDEASPEASQASALLRDKHSKTNAFAVMVLKMASAMRNSSIREYSMLIKDLLTVEKNFAGQIFAAEAALLRAVFIDRQGDPLEALKILSSLHEYPDRNLAAESCFRAGEIYFRLNRYADAKKQFLNASALNPDSWGADIALLRAGDCGMAGKSPLPQALVNEAAGYFAQIARRSEHRMLILEAFCKHAMAMEHSGRTAEAIQSYENAIQTAINIHSQGMIPTALWLEKSCESALRLTAANGDIKARQKGLQLLERCRHVLADDNMVKILRDNFLKELSKAK